MWTKGVSKKEEVNGFGVVFWLQFQPGFFPKSTSCSFLMFHDKVRDDTHMCREANHNMSGWKYEAGARLCPRWHQFSPDRNQLESYRLPNQDTQKLNTLLRGINSYEYMQTGSVRDWKPRPVMVVLGCRRCRRRCWHQALSIKVATLKSLEGFNIATYKNVDEGNIGWPAVCRGLEKSRQMRK